MNLDISPLGWIHTIASIFALVAGAVVLLGAKGTARHRAFGMAYLASAAVTSLTALGIYRIGIFFFPHWTAIAALALITAGFLCVRFGGKSAMWLRAHLTCMVASYYLLVGGGVNEVFLRVDVLHAAAPDVLHSRLVGIVHTAVAAAFLVMIISFNLGRLVRQRAQAVAVKPAAGAAAR
jgi:uncharacterized membrane protein